ncbi:hypothetical protein MRX96_026142 [Rhipicephalus microplus]
MPPTALPDEDLAALCRERMRKKPGFAALVGPGIPSADASAPDDLKIGEDLGYKDYCGGLLSSDVIKWYQLHELKDRSLYKAI